MNSLTDCIDKNLKKSLQKSLQLDVQTDTLLKDIEICYLYIPFYTRYFQIYVGFKKNGGSPAKRVIDES